MATDIMQEFIPLFVPDIREEDIQKVAEVLRSGMLVQGKNVEELEKVFCEITGAKHAIAASNGTATLHLVLHALGIKQGDEIIVPAFSYNATANVIELCGATPVFVDVEEGTLNINPALIEEKITKNTKAIMPVHEFGLAANLKKIVEIANKNGLDLIEDAACAVGAANEGNPIGKNAFAASFSLHPRKAITSGEGGIIVTNDDALDRKLRILRNHGIEMQGGQMEFVEAGFNYRLTDFQAALILNQTGRLFDQIEHKRKLAEIYLNELDTNCLQLPEVPSYTNHTWQTFHVILNKNIDRSAVISELRENKIGSNYGAQCMPETQFYKKKYNYDSEKLFPNAYRAYKQGLALPMYPLLTAENVQYICKQLNHILNKNNGK